MNPAALPIRSVNHIARTTHDLDASIAFYRDVLGFEPIRRPDFGFPGAWLFNYGVQLHLIASRVAGPDPQEIQSRTDHVAFHVDDIEPVQDLLTQHGIPFKTNHVPTTGVTQLFFVDPDGNHIEIGCYPPAVKG